MKHFIFVPLRTIVQSYTIQDGKATTKRNPFSEILPAVSNKTSDTSADNVHTATRMQNPLQYAMLECLTQLLSEPNLDRAQLQAMLGGTSLFLTLKGYIEQIVLSSEMSIFHCSKCSYAREWNFE